MKKRIDNFLLGILWLLAAVLATSFWFNIRFGFDLFSGAHWSYLAQLQATNNSVNVSFYISLAIATLITLLGLYIIIRPRFRKINFASATNTSNQTKDKENTDINEEKTLQSTPTSSYSDIRPPKLNLPKQTIQHIPVIHDSTPKTLPIEPPYTTQKDDIIDIFKRYGYTIKKTPNISGIKTVLFAIAPNEVVWMGAENISTLEMKQAVTELNKLFVDSLEDLTININAFIFKPSDTTDNNDDIFIFNSISELADFIKSNPADPTPTDKDKLETFNAFSEYINVVIDFINRG